ncbi:hypothetical protein ACFQLX_11785 [Streptomyces polyrhachis]|uniref:GNAT-like C-terminal domain-containing protein n=1 Tax=Streptomyces polyrhachis TaxID=1282885 RepID=A0ABW2GDI3_9ACTN
MVVVAFAFSTPKHDPHNVCLLSDFPVTPTSYRRLAKLVLYAALSYEERRARMEQLRRELDSCLTDGDGESP